MNELNRRNFLLRTGTGLSAAWPTMTIEALAFRAADRMTALAKRGEISA